MSLKKRLLLAAISGVLLVLCQPNPLGLEMGLVGFIALAPLYLALAGTSGRQLEAGHNVSKMENLAGLNVLLEGRHGSATGGQAFLVGFVAGVVAFTGILYWVAFTMTTYAGMTWPVSIFFLMLLVFVEASYIGLFAVIAALLREKLKFNSLVAFATAWCACEYFRGIFPFGGFPWSLLGYSLGGYIHFAQIADVVGVYGLGFLEAMVAALLGAASANLYASRPRKELYASLGLALCIVALMFVYGQYRINDVDKKFEAAPEMEVALLQGNIEQSLKWDPSEEDKILNTYIDLSRDATMDGSPEIIIWPEASIPYWFEHDLKALKLRKRLKRIGTYFLVGSPDAKILPDKINYLNVNAAYLVSPTGATLGTYHKMHLVPFGEYVPIQKLLFFVDKIAGGAQGNFSAGEKMEVFTLSEKKFSCLICYEVIFPELSRTARVNGAQFLTTITNDAWFGRTSAPYQHFRAVVLRSIENHTYYARSANTGISGIIDPVGRVVAQSPLFVETIINGKIKVLDYPTIYMRFGNFLPIACFLFAIFALASPLAGRVVEKLKHNK